MERCMCPVQSIRDGRVAVSLFDVQTDLYLVMHKEVSGAIHLLNERVKEKASNANPAATIVSLSDGGLIDACDRVL